MPPAKSRSKSSPANLKSKPPAKASRPASASARTTVSGPARGVAPNGDAATVKAAGTEALASAFPFNAAKPTEFEDAARDPAIGQAVAPPHPSVTGSTLTETDGVAEDSAAAHRRIGVNPGNGPLDRVRVDSAGRVLTTNQGVPVADNQNSLKAGLRGPDAARGLHPAREDHALRPRAHPGARSCMRAARPRTATSSATSRSPS